MSKTNKNFRKFNGRKAFTLDYKNEVAEMVITGGMSQYDVSRQEGLPLGYVARWVREARPKNENKYDIDFLEVAPDDVKELICTLIHVWLEPKPLDKDLSKDKGRK